MPKKLRREPIYIAPEIRGWIDERGNPIVIDEQNGRQLNPAEIEDKIIIYERQVKDWFLIPATNLSKHRNKNKGFIVLMICFSYLEGVEQYRQGLNSYNGSRRFFVAAMGRLYPDEFHERQLNDLYSEARCGLFHDGMVKGRILINNEFRKSIEFDSDDIKVSPSKFLKDIKQDFENYLQELRTPGPLRNNFDSSYSNI